MDSFLVWWSSLLSHVEIWPIPNPHGCFACRISPLQGQTHSPKDCPKAYQTAWARTNISSVTESGCPNSLMFGLLICNCLNSQFFTELKNFRKSTKKAVQTFPATVLIGQSIVSAPIPMTRPLNPYESKIQGVHRIAIEPWKNPIVFGFLKGTSPDSLQLDSKWGSKKGLVKASYRHEISWNKTPQAFAHPDSDHQHVLGHSECHLWCSASLSSGDLKPAPRQPVLERLANAKWGFSGWMIWS